MRCATCGDEALPGQQFCARHRGARAGATSTAPAGPREVYATFWQRFAALILDFLIVWTVTFIIGMAAAIWYREPSAAIVLILVLVLYYPAFECSPLQATPGKLAVGIKVTRRDGERIGVGRAIVRYIGRWISTLILCIGFVMPLFTARREALHDKIAGTLVVEKKADAPRIAEAGPATPTPIGGIAAAFAVLIFVSLFGVGMVAAIAIPAYQDYTIRAQVMSAIELAQEYEFAVMARYRQTGSFEGITGEDLFVMPPRHPYVESFVVEDGGVVMTLGGQADKKVHGEVLAWGPAADANGVISWLCGRAPAPEEATLVTLHPAEHTSVPDKYLPVKCRGGSTRAN